MEDDEKPFACSELGCGMQFTNEDHLAVHMRKHDMSLALNLSGTGMLSPNIGCFTDQTPTPTKFLKNLEEMGLFQELNKNPFDDSFKKAMDDNLETISVSHINLPISYANDLDTPQPSLPRIVIGDCDMGMKGADKTKDTLSSIVPKKRKKFLRQQSMPTSTTSEDESESVIGSSVEIGPAIMETEGDYSVEVVEAPPTSIQEHVSSTQAVLNTTEVISVSSPAQVVTSSVVVEPQTSKAQPQQAMVQVLLQLPGGQTVPLQVPAANIVSPKQAALSSQQPVNTPAPKPAHVIQTVNQNVPPYIVTGNQPMVQNVQGTIFNQPQTIIKPAPQTNIPMTVRTIQLGTNQVVRNQQNIMQNIVNQDTNNIKTILASDASGAMKTIMIHQNPVTQTVAGIQPGQNVITVSPPKVNISQNKVQSGSQSYTKQRLKAALQQQQQTSSVGSQKISQILQANEIKQELRVDFDSQSVVSSTGSISSPEERTYTQGTGNQFISESFEDSETRRKKFLERNRAAAARCRQKRKYWITNLESKAEDLSSQNNRLCNEVKSLRSEVAELKTLLIAHKDCPVTMQQRSQGQITTDTLKINSQKEPESADVHIIELDDQPETDANIMSSLPSVVLTNSMEKQVSVSSVNNGVQNVISVNSVPLNNNVTLPSIISMDGQMNGSTSNLGQYMIPRFVTMNQQSLGQEGTKTLSVIAGSNGVGLIPKLINLEQLIQGNINQPS